MKAQDHPEYAQEQAHLKDTLTALSALVQAIGGSAPVGGDEHAAEALYRQYGAEYEDLRLALPSPYFGRVDFEPDDGDETEPHYFGKKGFSYLGQRVIDWQAPIAALFYEGRPGEASYRSPDGDVKGFELLKRNLGIESGSLATIADEFDLRERPGRERSIVLDPDEYLREVLSGRQNVQLREIVATIQAQQYQLIRADPGQVLVVQGAAGSGKTSIALHRMAFLLYHSKDNGIQARNCVIFGPNRLFLNYIAQVLPDLSVRDMAQKTLVDWACEQMNLKGMQLTDGVLDIVLSSERPREERVAHYRRSRLKNSLRMGALLERYVEYRRRQMTYPEEGLTEAGIGPLQVTVHLTKAEIAESYDSFMELPLRKHRDRYLETLRRLMAGRYDSAVKEKAQELARPGREQLSQAMHLREEAEQLEKLADSIRATGDAGLKQNMTAESLERGAAGLRESAAYYQQQGEQLVLRADSQLERAEQEETRQRAMDELAERLVVEMDHYWPAFDPIKDYYVLLADKALLNEMGHELFKADELELMCQPERPKNNVVDLSDLAGLHFLHTIVEGVAVAPFDHILLDEAQDVSPLHLEILGRMSRTGSLTIVGDLAQSIYAHRGISNWDEVQSAFPAFKYSYNQVKRGYRSTYEIMRFANTVLRSIAQKGRTVTLPELFERHGEAPGIHRLTTADLPMKVARLVREARDKGYRNIAIITKTVDDCLKLVQLFRDAKLDKLAVATTPDFEYEGGVVLLPVHLAKGMEFEAVLVVGTDDQTYTATEFDGRLLYVALTRALHVLHILWTGNITTHLASVVPQSNARRATKSAAKR